MCCQILRSLQTCSSALLRVSLEDAVRFRCGVRGPPPRLFISRLAKFDEIAVRLATARMAFLQSSLPGVVEFGDVGVMGEPGTGEATRGIVSGEVGVAGEPGCMFSRIGAIGFASDPRWIFATRVAGLIGLAGSSRIIPLADSRSSLFAPSLEESMLRFDLTK
ncbi:catabolite degradation [Moniliophthora roreri]|nr:catabolite degradation [Moniliophthora roreri]